LFTKADRVKLGERYPRRCVFVPGDPGGGQTMKERLLSLLRDLGYSGPEGLAWLSGAHRRSGRAVFLVPQAALQEYLQQVGSKKRGRVDPRCFFDLVVSSDGSVLSLEEVRAAKRCDGDLCALFALDPLVPLNAEQIAQVNQWDTLSDDERDALFEGPLGQVVQILRRAHGDGTSGQIAAGLGPATPMAEVACSVRPQLDTSLADIEALPEQLQVNPEPACGDVRNGVVDGTGVVVGVIDFGCDFAHPCFRTADGSTRLLGLWDQNDTSAPSPGSRLGRSPGRVFTRAEINWALEPERHRRPDTLPDKGPPPHYVPADDAPYWRLGYDPHDRHYLDVEAMGGAHGTHVLDIAAGNGLAVLSGQPRNPGVAPNADLYFVQLGEREHDVAAVDWMQVLIGVAKIFRVASWLRRPAVVNLSLNGNDGAHDGNSLFDLVIGWLVQQAGRCVTVAAGNFRRQSCHVRRVVQSDDQATVLWEFPPHDQTLNRAEFWTNSAYSAFSLSGSLALGKETEIPLRFRLRDLLSGNGAADKGDGTSLPFGLAAEIWLSVHGCAPEDCAVGVASIRAVNGSDRRLQMLLSIDPEAVRALLRRHFGSVRREEMVLEISLHTHRLPGHEHEPPETLVIDGWIERDDFRIDKRGSNQADQSRFAVPDENYTLGSLSCGADTVVVGAYYDTPPDRPLWYHSSLGPTRVGGRKPDVSAPGRLIHAARSKGFRLRYPGSDSPWRTSATIVFSGTSMAAPHVAGIVALMLQADPALTGPEIADLLRRTARSAGRPKWWHPGLGYGRVSAVNALAALLDPATVAESV